MDLLPGPDRVFALGNGLALLGWVALALSPAARPWAARVRRVTGGVIPLALAAAYVVMVVVHWGPGGFGSLAEVRQLFDRPGLLAAGWLHYLAFDLFVGTWIARRGGALGLPHALVLPCLLLTFVFGPAGLLAFALLCRVRGQPFLLE
jgi:hypothetical protein